MNLSPYELGTYARGVRNVLWGDLLSTPRGFGYAALAMALTYIVAAVRARRVYLRATARPKTDFMTDLVTFLAEDYSSQEYRLQSQLHERLREDAITKFRTVMLCLAMAFALLAAQAHLLVAQSKLLASQEMMRINDELLRNDILFYAPGIPGTQAPAYYDMRLLFGFLALGMLVVWATSHYTCDECGRPFRTRVYDWLIELTGPVQPQDTPNAGHRLVMWVLRLDNANWEKKEASKHLL